MQSCSQLRLLQADAQSSESSSEDDSEEEESSSDTEEDAGKEEEGENEPLSLEWPETKRKRVTYLLLLPIVFPLWLTLPDVRNPVSEAVACQSAHPGATCDAPSAFSRRLGSILS